MCTKSQNHHADAPRHECRGRSRRSPCSGRSSPGRPCSDSGKRAAPFAANRVEDVPRRGAPALHRRRRDARHWLAVRRHHRKVADDEDLRMVRHAEIRAHDDAPSAIDRDGWAEQIAPKRRRGVARRPEDRACDDALVADADTASARPRSPSSRVRTSTPSSRRSRSACVGEILGERRQHARSALERE